MSVLKMTIPHTKKVPVLAGTSSGSSAGNKTINIKNQYSATVIVIICQRFCIMHLKPPRLAAAAVQNA